MLKLRDDGLARAVGVSNFDTLLLARCEASGHVDSSAAAVLAHQPRDRRRAPRLGEGPRHRRHLLQPDGIRPAHRLVLGGHGDGSAARRLATARRRLHPAGAGPQPGAARRPAAHRRAPRLDAAAVAVAWVLAWPGVTGAIVGARSPQQVDGWIDAAGLDSRRRTWTRSPRPSPSSGAGAGPADPRPAG